MRNIGSLRDFWNSEKPVVNTYEYSRLSLI